MSSASMHPTYPSQASHTLDSTPSHQRQSPSAPRHPAQPPFVHPSRNQAIPLESSLQHEQHQQQEQGNWYSRAQDPGFDHSDTHPPATPEHSSPAQNATFTSDHHHNAQSTESYRPNYQAYNPQADRYSAFQQSPQSTAPHHHPRQLPTSPHSDGSKHQGSLSRTSTLTIGPLRASYTSPQAQTRSDASVNNEHQRGPGRRQALSSHAHASSFDDTYKDTYEAPLTHAKREDQDDHGYGLPPLQHSYYSTPRSHREPNALFRTSESSPSASGSYSHASPSTSFPPPHHPSSRFITDNDGPGGQSSRYGHPTLSEAAPVPGFVAAAAAASSSPSPSSSSAHHRPQHHLPPLSESFGSSFPRPTSNMNLRPDGLIAPMPLAPSPLDHHGYPTAINTDLPSHASYSLDHPFSNDYSGEGSPGFESPGGLASNQTSPMRSPAKRGKKVEMACHFCRGRKLKCDGVQPRCQHCTRRGQVCAWDSHVRRRGPGLKNKTKEVKGGVSKRRESVSTSAGRSTMSPKTPARGPSDEFFDGPYRGPSEIMTPDGEFPPNRAYPIKGEEMEGDVPLTIGTGSQFAHPYPPSSNAYPQVPAQDPYATAHYPGQQQAHYGPPSPAVHGVIAMSRTSSLAGAMGTDPNYSAYHPNDNDQGSVAAQQDSAWRRHSITGGQCANPSAYISETTGGGAGPWDRDNGSDGGEAYTYHPPASSTTSTSSPAQYFNSQAVHHAYPQQQQQYPASPPSSIVYGTQQEYAQQRGYATSRDNHHHPHQHQQQVSPPMPGYEAGWFAHPAGEPGQAWSGHVGHASSAEVNPGGDSVVTHNPSSFSEIRVQGSVSPSQETDPSSSYNARSTTSETVSSSSTSSSPAQIAHDLYNHLPTPYHPASSLPVASRTTRHGMPSSSSVDNDLAQSLINLAHGPPAASGAGSVAGMVRRVSSLTATGGSEVGRTAVPMTESYTMASTSSTGTSGHRRTSSGEGSWDEARAVPRTNNATAGHASGIAFKPTLGSNNSPHSGHEVVY